MDQDPRMATYSQLLAEANARVVTLNGHVAEQTAQIKALVSERDELKKKLEEMAPKPE